MEGMQFPLVDGKNHLSFKPNTTIFGAIKMDRSRGRLLFCQSLNDLPICHHFWKAMVSPHIRVN